MSRHFVVCESVDSRYLKKLLGRVYSLPLDKAVKDMEAELYCILIFEIIVSVAKKIPSGEEQKIEDKMIHHLSFCCL